MCGAWIRRAQWQWATAGKWVIFFKARVSTVPMQSSKVKSTMMSWYSPPPPPRRKKKKRKKMNLYLWISEMHDCWNEKLEARRKGQAVFTTVNPFSGPSAGTYCDPSLAPHSPNPHFKWTGNSNSCIINLSPAIQFKMVFTCTGKPMYNMCSILSLRGSPCIVFETIPWIPNANHNLKVSNLVFYTQSAILICSLAISLLTEKYQNKTVQKKLLAWFGITTKQKMIDIT